MGVLFVHVHDAGYGGCAVIEEPHCMGMASRLLVWGFGMSAQCSGGAKGCICPAGPCHPI